MRVNQRVEILGLHTNFITDRGCVALGQMIGVNQKIRVLSIWNNAITDEGALHLAEGLKTNRSLEGIAAGFNCITGAGATALAGGLRVNKKLRHLWLNSNPIDQEGAQALNDALESNTTIEQVRLSVHGFEEYSDMVRPSIGGGFPLLGTGPHRLSTDYKRGVPYVPKSAVASEPRKMRHSMPARPVGTWESVEQKSSFFQPTATVGGVSAPPPAAAAAAEAAAATGATGATGAARAATEEIPRNDGPGYVVITEGSEYHRHSDIASTEKWSEAANVPVRRGSEGLPPSAPYAPAGTKVSNEVLVPCLGTSSMSSKGRMTDHNAGGAALTAKISQTSLKDDVPGTTTTRQEWLMQRPSGIMDRSSIFRSSIDTRDSRGSMSFEMIHPDSLINKDPRISLDYGSTEFPPVK